jgi:hypothetical protein
VAVIGVFVLMSFAAVACSSGEAEDPAGEDQKTVVSDSNATASPTMSDQTPTPTMSDQTPSRFVGEWASADYNGQFSLNADKPPFHTMTISAGDGGVLHITTVHDDFSDACSDTTTDTGRLESPTTLVASSLILACVDPQLLANQPGVDSNYTLVFDLVTDRLYDNLGLVWNRGAPPKKRPERSIGAGEEEPGPTAILFGEVTFREGPWNDTVESGLDPRSFYLVGPGDGGGETANIKILVNPLPEPCDRLRVPPSAAGMVQAIRSNLDLKSTVPVIERVGGIDALRMDVVAAAVPSTSCAEFPRFVVPVPGIEPASLARLYVLDLPGGSARTLAILITAPEAGLFERAVDEAAPLMKSFRFHSR